MSKIKRTNNFIPGIGGNAGHPAKMAQMAAQASQREVMRQLEKAEFSKCPKCGGIDFTVIQRIKVLSPMLSATRQRVKADFTLPKCANPDCGHIVEEFK